MPKSKAKRKKPAGARAKQTREISWGGKADKGAQRINLVLGALAVVLIVAGGAYWYLNAKNEGAFLAAAAEGQGRLGQQVVRNPDRGRGHGQPGAVYAYASEFPTSGQHDPVPTSARLLPGAPASRPAGPRPGAWQHRRLLRHSRSPKRWRP